MFARKQIYHWYDSARLAIGPGPAIGLILVLLSAPVAGAVAGEEPESDMGKFFTNWFERSDRAKESQPHWATPVITVTPRLEQEFRLDGNWQNRPGSTDFANYGGNKGLELIPSDNTEIILGVPTYQTIDGPKKDEKGWTDQSFLLKYRFLSENEEGGNYIVTGFLGLTVPTGSEDFTTRHTVVTPTLAVGKGWGTRDEGFDIQSTLGISVADGDQQTVGGPVVWNTAFQYHVWKLWPEIETSYTRWTEGPRAGNTQVMVSAGAILGRLPLYDRVKLVVGVAYQQPVTSYRIFDSSWILTARTPF